MLAPFLSFSISLFRHIFIHWTTKQAAQAELVVKSSKPSDLSSHTKSKPSNPNIATMEKKPSSSSSKAVKMVIPLDVIAEELKKTARKGTSFEGLHKKLFGTGNETTVCDSKKKEEVKENTRTLAIVLRSERELPGMNKEQEMEISQLKFMLEEKSTEVSDSVGLFFFFFVYFFSGKCSVWIGRKGGQRKGKKVGNLVWTFSLIFTIAIIGSYEIQHVNS